MSMNNPYDQDETCDGCTRDASECVCAIDDAQEWDAAMAAMKAHEGAWEDNGCHPFDGYPMPDHRL